MSDETAICPSCGASTNSRAAGTPCPQCLLRLCMSDDGSDTSPDSTREAPGTVIGRYTLIEEIGEGGFGIVYLAEQEAPVRRKVALKVLKPGMDTREVVSRFKAERQALALMDHPHIAQVYDGGGTESGRPYFVMELVDGTPITTYCAGHELSIRQRLELFLDVTAAVQHAHQKGIIHRDLKPSNILVSTHENRPVVKVIDFGVAKAMAVNLTETAVLTALGRMIGTPEYMSPEQADINAVDVDTRSDIYSLGVVLYELLTGTTPFDPSTLRKAGFTEMLRILREDKPPKPSARINSLRQQGMRELDWMVMQALEKDPARRYQTAMGFGLDIRRFLDDEPVSASPPSASYRFSKFVKRNLAAVVWTCVFVIVVVSATIGMTLLYFDAGRKAQIASEQRAVAVDAGDMAKKRTWEARVAQTAALRWSGKPERRFLAFDALREAAAITSGHDEPGNLKRLRDSAIACLAIADMRPVDSWKGNPGYCDLVAADPSLTKYATTHPDGRISIHGYPDHGLIVDLPGTGEPVSGKLCFSADGGCLAAGYGRENHWKLKLWNLRGSPSSIDAGLCVNKAFAFSPDGKQGFIGRPGGSIAVVEVGSEKEQRRFNLTGNIHALAVSETGRWLAVGFEDRVDLLDTGSGEKLASLACSVRALAWCPFGDSLAAGCADGTLRLWHDGNWEFPVYQLGGHTGAVDAVAWSPNGRLLATQGMDGTVRLWDPFQGAELSWHSGRASDLCFSSDGKRLGVLREGETLTVMEVEPGDVCDRGRKHVGEAGVTAGAWNAEGTLAATTGDDGVRLWNRAGLQLAMIKLPKARGVAFSGDALFVSAGDGLRRWKVSRREVAGGLEMELQAPEVIDSFRSCEQIALSRDGSVLVLAGRRAGYDDEAVWMLDLKGGGESRTIAAPKGVAYCAISPDLGWIAAGTRNGDGVRIWKTGETDAPVDLPIHGSAKVAFSPDGKWFVTGDTEAYRFWEPGSWKLKHKIPSEMGGGSGQMAYSPRMTALIIACRRAELKVINPFTLEELSAPDFDRESPLCFDPHGRIMVTTGQSGGLFFWKLDAVRSGLVAIGLDWAHMPPFPVLELPVVKRVILPGASF